MQKQRLSRELARLSTSPPHGITISHNLDKLDIIQVEIKGPSNTPYKNGIFKVEVTIPEKYPFSPPSMKFLTRIYHPNIDDSGQICLDLIKMPPVGSWRPTIGLEGLLIALQMLMESPNPEDPLMVDIAEEYKNAREEFVKKAEIMTTQFAV